MDGNGFYIEGTNTTDEMAALIGRVRKVVIEGRRIDEVYPQPLGYHKFNVEKGAYLKWSLSGEKFHEDVWAVVKELGWNGRSPSMAEFVAGCRGYVGKLLGLVEVLAGICKSQKPPQLGDWNWPDIQRQAEEALAEYTGDKGLEE